MNKKYWSGTTRIISDMFWCIVIVSLMTFLKHGSLIETIPSHVGGAIGSFFTFFFWSWNKEHLKSRVAKYSIHTLVGLYAIVALFVVGLCVFYPSILFSYIMWCPLVFFSVQAFFVFRKYKRLMFCRYSRLNEIVK